MCMVCLFVCLYSIKESKHVAIFISKHSDKLQKLRDKLQYLQIIGIYMHVCTTHN